MKRKVPGTVWLNGVTNKALNWGEDTRKEGTFSR